MKNQMLAKGPMRIQAEERARARSLMVQPMLKSGVWGKDLETKRFGNETDEDVIARLEKNNNKQFRIAE